MVPKHHLPGRRRHDGHDDRTEFSYEQRRTAAMDAVRMVSATLDGDR